MPPSWLLFPGLLLVAGCWLLIADMANFTNIRYGKMRLVGRFKTERDDIRPRDKCVVRTDRG